MSSKIKNFFKEFFFILWSCFCYALFEGQALLQQLIKNITRQIILSSDFHKLFIAILLNFYTLFRAKPPTIFPTALL